MSSVLVDSCVIHDLSDPDGEWYEWSASMLEALDAEHVLAINPVIYSECSVSYATIEETESLFECLGFHYQEIPRDALFLAGKAFLDYRRRGGTKTNVLPDFFIGAHAVVEGFSLVTRDMSRFATYFPGLPLIMPNR